MGPAEEILAARELQPHPAVDSGRLCLADDMEEALAVTEACIMTATGMATTDMVGVGDSSYPSTASIHSWPHAIALLGITIRAFRPMLRRPM